MFLPVDTRVADIVQRVNTRWWLTAFWLFWCVATTLMLLPASQLPHVNIWDKAEHAGTFFVLGALAWLGYRRQQRAGKLAVLLIGYGFVIECIQYFIPSRSFSLEDVLADAIGIAPAYWLAMRLAWQ